jgi:hypothetical protein
VPRGLEVVEDRGKILLLLGVVRERLELAQLLAVTSDVLLVAVHVERGQRRGVDVGEALLQLGRRQCRVGEVGARPLRQQQFAAIGVGPT